MRDWAEFERRKLWPPFTWADFPPEFANHGDCHQAFRREDWERRAQAAVDSVSSDHNLTTIAESHKSHRHPWCEGCVLEELDYERDHFSTPLPTSEELDDYGFDQILDEAHVSALSRVRYWMTNHKGEIPIEQPLDESSLDEEFLDRHDLDGLPTPDPLIEGILPRHSYGILRGRDGTYKSFVALDWALCLATGKPWQGRTAERVKVLYIAGEGAYGLAARIDAWEQSWGHDIEPETFVVRRSALNMHKPGRAFDHLLDHIETGGYGLVIVDTLRRVSGAADGNGSDMGAIVDNLDRIKRATQNGTVLAIAHTDKGDHDTRGYSGIEDDADFVWHARREERELTLELTKMKDGPDGIVVTLRADTVLGSLVLSASSGTESTTTESQLRILDTLRSSFRDGAYGGQLLEATGLSKTTYYRALGELKDAGHVVNTGTGRRPFYELTPSPVPIDHTPPDLRESHESHGLPLAAVGVPSVPPPSRAGLGHTDTQTREASA